MQTEIAGKGGAVKKENILIVLIAFLSIAALIIGYAKLYRHPSSLGGQPQAQNLEVDNTNEEPAFFKKAPEILERVKGIFDCSSLHKIKASLGENDQERLWQSKNGNDGSFIYFDKKNRTFTVCDQGKSVAAKFPRVGDLSDDVEMVNVSEAHFGDINGDGKKEFIVFDGQCVEGPCLGDYYMYRLDGDRIKKLYTLHADSLDFIDDNHHQALAMERTCFAYDFGIGFSYLAVAEFDKNGELMMVPFQEIRLRYPKVVSKFERDFMPEETDGEKVFGRLQNLIFDAYKGKSEKDLLASYNEILNSRPKADNEQKLEDRVPLHCSPWKIIQKISAREATTSK